VYCLSFWGNGIMALSFIQNNVSLHLAIETFINEIIPLYHEKEDEDIKNVFEPDITVVCDQSKIDKQGCKGIPDLIIEIISPSSIKHDRVTKFNQYEKAGVLEYWIVEPEGKLVSVFLLQSNGRYGRPEIYTEEETINVSIFPDLTVDLNAVFPSV